METKKVILRQFEASP